MSFRWKTILGLVVIQVVLLGLLILSSMNTLHDATEDAVSQRARTVASLFASLTQESILATDLAALDVYVQDLMRQQGVRYVRILDRRGMLLAQAGTTEILARSFSQDHDMHTVTDGVYDVMAMVGEGDAKIGQIQLGMDAHYISGTLLSSLRTIASIATAELFLTILFAFFLGQYLTRQLGSLMVASQTLASGNLDFRVQVTSQDELGQTATAFNRMADRLKAQQTRLAKSEERLKLALDGSNDGLWDWHVPSGAVYFSPRFETMLGYAPGELHPHVDTWIEMLHADDKEQVMAVLAEHLEGQSASYQTEHRVRNKDGDWIWILDRGKVVKRDAQGQPLRAVGTYTDICQRKIIEQERDRLGQVVKQSPISIMITDLEGRLEYVNPGFETLTGYSQQEVVGRNPRFLKSGYQPPQKYQEIWQTITQGREWCGELLNKKKGGERFWESATISPIRDSTGRISHYLGIKEDITQRKRTEDALLKSTKQLSRAQRIANIGNWEWHIPDNRIVWSQEVDRLLGLQEGVEPTYALFVSKIHPEDQAGVEQEIKVALQSGENYKFEHRISRSDGTILVVQEVGEVVRNEQGVAVYLNGTIQDITERKKAERLKNEFVSTVSHELRTPLTSIYGSLKMVLAGVTGPLPDKARNLVQIACSNSERLNLLINDILDIQKMESGKMAFQFKRLDAASVVHRAVEENRSYAEKFGVVYRIMEPLPEGLMVLGDESRLCQVLANFLSNAAKFTELGDEVVIRLEYVESWVQFSVIDHGAGIGEAFYSQVFEKFAQADASDTRKKGGTGLGLSISKALVESHHGEIGFRSKPGEETVFFFKLPAVSVEDISGEM